MPRALVCKISKTFFLINENGKYFVLFQKNDHTLTLFQTMFGNLLHGVGNTFWGLILGKMTTFCWLLSLCNTRYDRYWVLWQRG
jgi:hypothetical protein